MLRTLMIVASALTLSLGVNLVPGSGAWLGGLSHASAAGNTASSAGRACAGKGYLSLIGTNGSTDTTFANVGQCTVYGISRGTLVSKTAAAPCLNDGYQSLAPQDNPSVAFTSEAACVQYVGQGGTTVQASTCPSSGTGLGTICFTNLALPFDTDSSLGTLTLTGQYTFNSPTCGGPCGSATGGGTYTVSGGTFNGGTSGTFTVTETLYTEYHDSSFNPTSCGSLWAGTVYVAATFTDANTQQTTQTEIVMDPFAAGPSEGGVLNTSNTPYYFGLSIPSSQFAINC
jgi:hypothetical protein